VPGGARRSAGCLLQASLEWFDAPIDNRFQYRDDVLDEFVVSQVRVRMVLRDAAAREGVPGWTQVQVVGPMTTQDGVRSNQNRGAKRGAEGAGAGMEWSVCPPPVRHPCSFHARSGANPAITMEGLKDFKRQEVLGSFAQRTTQRACARPWEKRPNRM
jgi:hypothetical protein